MSKRKGRRHPLTSEIKSVMRAPPDAEGELEPSREALDADVAAEPSSPAPSEPGAARGNADAGDDEQPAREAPEPASGAMLDEYDTALDEAAAAIGRSDLTLEEPDSLAEPASAAAPQSLAAPETASQSGRRSRRGSAAAEGDVAMDPGDVFTADPASAAAEAEDDDDVGEGPLRFAAPISFDDTGDDTEGFLRGLVEALLFTSQKPVDVKDLARSAGIDKPRARELIEQLRQRYDGGGLCIEEVAGGFVMRSAPRYAPYIHKILALKPVRLSRAQLETLAIVAYRQPVTKPEVDDIRGVDSGQVIKGLLERSLLKMLGKKDEPGHPTLYGTTNEFLELLNLQSLKDLPTLREYTELSEESQRKFMEETGEAAPSDTMSFERPAATAEDGAARAAETEPAPEAAEGAEPTHAPGHDAEGHREPAPRSQSDVVPIDEDQLGEPEGGAELVAADVPDAEDGLHEREEPDLRQVGLEELGAEELGADADADSSTRSWDPDAEDER